jgi:hypothetical protein
LKKAWQVTFNMKVMWRVFFFFDIKDGVHHELLRQVQTKNHWYYLEVMKLLRESVRKKRSQLWRNNSWFLHHDSASSCTTTNLCHFGQPEHNCASSDIPLTWCGSGRLFLISQTEIHLERMMISDKRLQKICRRSYVQSQKGIPGLFPEAAMVLGVVHQYRREELWRW